MRIKEGYIIRKLGIGYIVVTVGDASDDFNGLIRLNEPGAFLWQSIMDGMDTKQKLVDAMVRRYDGIDEKTAEKDLDEFLETVSFAMEE